MSGSIVTGDADPYGEPNALPQKMKNLDVSNAFPGPIKGPHLKCESPPNRTKKVTSPRHQHFPTMHDILSTHSICQHSIFPTFYMRQGLLEAQLPTRVRILAQSQSTDRLPVLQMDSLSAQHVLHVSSKATKLTQFFECSHVAKRRVGKRGGGSIDLVVRVRSFYYRFRCLSLSSGDISEIS